MPKIGYRVPITWLKSRRKTRLEVMTPKVVISLVNVSPIDEFRFHEALSGGL
jgi:hypothetical protein